MSGDRGFTSRTTMDALAAAPDVFETFFEYVLFGLALADLSTNHVRVNQAYATLVGRPAEDLIGVPLHELVHPDDRAGLDARIEALLAGREPSVTEESRYLQPDGTVTWVLHRVTVVPDGTGRPGWLAVSAQDVTGRRRAMDDLKELTAVLTEQAIRDPLTGLANRALLEERLRARLSRDARAGSSTSLLFLDLDGFKAVNDEYGHGIGDIVLRTVASRLVSVVRPSDTVARLGGDEFVVLVEDADADALAVLTERLSSVVNEPIRHDDLELRVGVSIGASTEVAGAVDPGTLLATADAEMYRAKRRRKRATA